MLAYSWYLNIRDSKFFLNINMGIILLSSNLRVILQQKRNFVVNEYMTGIPLLQITMMDKGETYAG